MEPKTNEESLVKAQSPYRMSAYAPWEKLLVPLALVLGALFDWAVFTDAPEFQRIYARFSAFMLAFVLSYAVMNFRVIQKNVLGWVLFALTVSQCAWGFFFHADVPYGGMNLLMLFFTSMLYAEFAVSDLSMKQSGVVAAKWLRGWFFLPFYHIGHAFFALIPKRGVDMRLTLRVLAGLALAVGILLAVLPLLMSADGVFDMYIGNALGGLRPDVIGHIITALVAAVLIYSFLRGTHVDRAWTVKTPQFSLDPVVMSVALGVLLAVYALFTAVQFRYLFAQAGLPEQLTYSEYARQGFGQLIAVSAINYGVFGLLLRYGPEAKWFRGMLVGLLAATAVMLWSGAMRLSMYISAYGFTWLRLLSAWFIVFLCAALLLSVFRLVRAKFPLLAVCVVMLIVWFGVLGYANPDRFIETFNARGGYEVEATDEEIMP